MGAVKSSSVLKVEWYDIGDEGSTDDEEEGGVEEEGDAEEDEGDSRVASAEERRHSTIG